MKHSITLEDNNANFYTVAGTIFIYDSLKNPYICKSYINKILGNTPSKIQLTISIKNPKKKGYSKYEMWTNTTLADTIKGTKLVTYDQVSYLKSMGIPNIFWMKIEEMH